MKSQAGDARLRERAEGLFKKQYDKAARTAREERDAELAELRDKMARLKALREGKASP
jgi:hypothetical protein